MLRGSALTPLSSGQIREMFEMFELPPTLKSRLMAPGIVRAPELIRLLEAIVEAYRCEVPKVRSVVLLGGITLGEYHPGFSDVDLAIVFEGEAPEPVSRSRSSPPTMKQRRQQSDLPEVVCAAIRRIGFCPETTVRAKHVGSNVLNAMKDQDWQTWAAWSADNLVTESSYPFTLCDTWLIHNRALTLSGSCAKNRFPYVNAPPTHHDVELAELKRLANRLARPRPFGGLSGMELAAEFIYYGTDLTRAIYTLRTGGVIGRVASTKWYQQLFGGANGEYAQLMGECRCNPERSDLSRIWDSASLWMLFLHYAREALCFALPAADVPRSLPGQDEFGSWLEAWITSQST